MARGEKLARFLAWAGAGGAALFFAASALGPPIGWNQDEALFLLLARSLGHGVYTLPFCGGCVVTDPLPGYAFLMALPVILLDPHWGLLRWLGAAAAGAFVFITWRLGRRLLPGRWAAGAALMTAWSPVLVEQAGRTMPDVLAMGAVTCALLLLAEPQGRRRWGAIWTLAGAAADPTWTELRDSL